MTLRFQTSTRRTGMLRIARVIIVTDRAEFEAESRKQLRRIGGNLERDGVEDNNPRWRADAQTIIGQRWWEDRDPKPHQATMLFWEPRLSANVIAHEAAHVALHFYQIDCYRDNARASAHMHIGNEVIPYIIGDLFTAIVGKVLNDGETITIGANTRGQPI